MEVIFPDVGEGITEGKLIKWLVKVGDSIKADQTVAEIETDKAVIELPAPSAGIIEELLAKEHDTIIVGKPLYKITGATQKQAETKKENKIETENKITNKAISTQSSGVLALPSTRKLAAELNVDITKIRATGPQGRITETDVRNAGNTVAPKEMKETTQKEIIATPSVRQRARELKIDINNITPTGNAGKITIEDVERAAQTPAQTRSVESVSSVSKSGDQRIPITPLRKIIINNLTRSQHTTIHVTHTDTVDMTKIVKIRDKEAKKAEKKGIKLTYLSLIAKATSAAIQEHPYLNSELDENTQEIILRSEHDFGIAVDTPEGLIVPVIRGVQTKPILEIAKAIVDVATRAREHKLKPEELKGSTFTISSIGSIGGEAFTPIINYPNTAILGVGTISDKPAVVNGKIMVRKLCTLSLTYDHRIIDGAEAARFINDLKEYLEDPADLLIHLW